MNTEGPTQPGYGAVAKILHWSILLLLAAQYAVGELMPQISAKTPNEGLVSWHLSLGTAILFFMIVRWVWRLTHPVPLPHDIAPWERRLAAATHRLLYALIIAITVLGWAAGNFRGWDINLFGVLTLTPLAAKGTPWAHTAGDVHVVLVNVLLGVIALHAAGALYHHFFKGDGVLRRMIPDFNKQNGV